jgi:hypothetical protein
MEDKFDKSLEKYLVATMPAKFSKATKKKVGRPRKNKSIVQGYPAVQIQVVANGYQLSVNIDKTVLSSEVFVFNKIEDLSEWLRENLHPKYKNAEFLEKL